MEKVRGELCGSLGGGRACAKALRQKHDGREQAWLVLEIRRPVCVAGWSRVGEGD